MWMHCTTYMLNARFIGHCTAHLSTRSLACSLLLASLLLSACSAPVRAVTDYVQFKRGGSQANVAKTPLTPGFDYLLITVNRKSFLMARGGTESSPDGAIDIWYSGSREVMRLQNGRIIGSSGTPVEWTDVSLSAQPDWQQIHGPIDIQRRRDVSPGYHFGLRDVLMVQPIAAPSSSAFYGRLPADLHWFSETSSGPYPLPTSKYAVRFDGSRNEVIYGEQCLSESLCFSWQRWPNRT